MNRRIIPLTLATLAVAAPALLVAGCGGSDSDAPAGTTVAAAPEEVTYTAAQTKIATKVGETFGIKLASNPSTGYSWQEVGQKGTGGVSLVRSEFLPGTTGKGAVGAPGNSLFTYRADRAGTVKVSLGYTPPGGKKAVKGATFTITIK